MNFDKCKESDVNDLISDLTLMVSNYRTKLCPMHAYATMFSALVYIIFRDAPSDKDALEIIQKSISQAIQQHR